MSRYGIYLFLFAVKYIKLITNNVLYGGVILGNEKIAIMADSACDLPMELINHYNIKVIPLKVIYPDGEYSDRVDIQPSTVYSRMPAEIPTTSMPSVNEIKELIGNIKQQGFTHLLAIHISSGLSGTVDAVRLAAKDFDSMVIKVLDSKTLSMGTGWMIIEAAKSIANGFNFQEIVDRLHSLRERMKVFYILETLEYLRKGGRIGQVAGMLGQFLDVKPVISVNEEGKYFTYCKARGRSKSIEKLANIVEEAVNNSTIHLAVVHGGAAQEFEALVNRLKILPNIKEFISSDISPALGVHTGPGLLGVCFYEA
jgi:DegV family protein with EDD domain